MQKLLLSLCLFVGLVGFAPATPMLAQAEDGVKITVTVPQVWLRGEPSLLGGNVASVKKGDFYNAKQV